MSVPTASAIFRRLFGRLSHAGGVRAFLPLLVWAAVVWMIGGLASVPGDPDVTQKLDKVGHLAMYGALGFLCGRGWSLSGGRGGAAAVLMGLAMAMGAADEWRQLGIAGRSGSAADWVADAVGVVAGFFLGVSYLRQRQRT